MEPNQSAGSAPSFWRYLINPDKSATLQFDQLCRGIAKVIATLEPGPDNELTPSRLATFYRAVGGNYDSLFLKSSDHALSFMYQTLGCFHSLQPTPSPFETPRIPSLTPAGFARWQTIQLLLCPEENVAFIQKAVQLWNVPMPNGGTYPKYIPNDVFPSRPDEEMEKWHKLVTGKLNQQNYNLRRIKNSPYQSPHLEAYDRRDGYFSATQTGRPVRPSRSSSRDDQDHQTDIYRRRSSVPDFPSPSGERGSPLDPRHQYEARKTRSHSAQRPSPKPSRPRSHTTTAPPGHHKTSSNSPSNRRQGTAPSEQPGRRPSSGYNNAQYRSPARSPSTVDEDTGSEGSSEASQAGRHHRRSDEDRKSRRSSLWVPSFMRSSHKRRHSSDAGYRAPGTASKSSQPSRPEHYSQRAIKPAPQPPHQPYGGGRPPQWRETVWDNDTPSSTPATPIPENAQAQFDPRAPSIRFQEQTNFEPLTRESSSGSDNRHRSSDWERGNAQRRPVQAPPRIATVTGVQGRKYPTADPMSPIERQRSQNTRGNFTAMA